MQKRLSGTHLPQNSTLHFRSNFFGESLYRMRRRFLPERLTLHIEATAAPASPRSLIFSLGLTPPSPAIGS